MPVCSMACTTIFLALGALVVFKLTLSFFHCLSSYFISPLLVRSFQNLKCLGDWAVVTGCTDGIGKAYAMQLARRGFNIILLSRSVEKLESAADAIRRQTGVQTIIIQADFSNSSQDLYNRIANKLSDLDIGILVNNVGACYDYPLYFCDLCTEKIWQLINVNVGAVTFMTRAILPGMLKRKRGAIINLSSYSGLYPVGLLSVYSATKSYVDHFSRSLQQEYSKDGIFIQSVTTMVVATKMTEGRWTNSLSLLPEDYAREAVKTIGRLGVTCGHRFHAVQFWLIQLLPEWFRDVMTFRVNLAVLNKHCTQNS